MSVRITASRDKKGLAHPLSELYIRRAIKMTLAEEKITDSVLVSVMLTDEEGIRDINREFRNIDSATDVLSFPMNELEPEKYDPDICERDPDTGRILLGDMIICVPRCAEQAVTYGHSYKRELSYLSIHSTLHLLGYDHMDEGPMKKQMRDKEKKIIGDKD